MAKVYTTVPGSVQTIGSYGNASEKDPAIVPENVAAEYEGLKEFRVERDEPAPKVAAGKTPVKGKE